MGQIEYRTMREDERPGFLALMDTAFADTDTSHFARYLDEDPCLGTADTLVAVDGGRLVSAVQIFTRTIRLGGEGVLLGGIGSVATHPSYEGRGQATELLRRAIVEMHGRGMALSLLFTGRPSFYERLGWMSIPHSLLVVRARRAGGERVGRAFGSADLPEVKRLYQLYSGARPGVTLRDDTYWSAQLRFAGNPDERFRVCERGGRVVAYAREIAFVTLSRIMEHGCEPGAEGELAALLLGLAPDDAPLFLPRCDARLEAALESRAATCDVVAFPDQMWRILDRDRLGRLAGPAEGTDDLVLLESLVTGEENVYWPSDRF